MQPQKALDTLLSHNVIPCEGGEHAIADQYLYALSFTVQGTL